MTKKKIEFSKLLLVLIFLVFTFTVFYGITRDYSVITDSTVFVTAISVTGGILGVGVAWYLKKSQTEHVATSGGYMYKSVMDIRYEYNKKMMELKNKYKITDDELSEIESDSPIDDISDSIVNNMQTKFDSQMDEATSSTDYQVLG